MLLTQCNLTGATCRLLLVSEEFCSPRTDVVVTMSLSGNNEVVGSLAVFCSYENRNFHEHMYIYIHIHKTV